MSAVIAAEKVYKRYGEKTVIDHISYVVQSKQCFGFLGPNGAGKTTSLRAIIGQSPIDGGSLKVFDRAMPDYGREVRAKIGVVPQFDNLDPDFTVMENLVVYGSYFGLKKAQLKKTIEYLLDFTGLKDRAQDKISVL